MPTDRLLPAGHPPLRSGAPSLVVRYDHLTNASMFVCVASGFVAFLEPSPYDVLSIVTIALWFLGGFTVHRLIVPLAALMALYNAGGFLSLLPHLDEGDSTTFMVESLYLGVTAIFFALFFAENTIERAERCLKAYAVSTVLASLCAIAGYFNLFGTGDMFTLYGRASGAFKDPNVLGSYLILGAVYFIQTIVLGRTRHLLMSVASLVVAVIGIFLSFSRGSWAAFTVATMLCVGFAFVSSQTAATRRRIVVMMMITLCVAAAAIVVLLSIDSIRDFFLQRAAVEQDYDAGETGRFGNQLRALPLLLERLNGFGPVRFRLFFDADPHNSYINSFASYGWLGGSAFLLLVGLTMFIGFRLALSRSPFQRLAQVYWSALFVILIQAFQIDIDHWRHVYLMLGAVWGLETARQRWMSRQAKAGLVGAGPGPAPTLGPGMIRLSGGQNPQIQ